MPARYFASVEMAVSPRSGTGSKKRRSWSSKQKASTDSQRRDSPLLERQTASKGGQNDEVRYFVVRSYRPVVKSISTI